MRPVRQMGIQTTSVKSNVCAAKLITAKLEKEELCIIKARPMIKGTRGL
jgi:hypothetical protein